MNQVKGKLLGLWGSIPIKFLFSESLKHQDITLSESGRKAVSKAGWLNVLIEPALPMERTSSISFKIHKLFVSVGVCYRKIV